jgi:hypothetical protein
VSVEVPESVQEKKKVGSRRELGYVIPVIFPHFFFKGLSTHPRGIIWIDRKPDRREE